MKTLGFVGTGTITRHFIEGLIAANVENPVLVSPRSESISTELQNRFKTVIRSRSNKDVVEHSDIIFLAMLPHQVEEALQSVCFKRHQILCSFVSGLSLDDLQDIAPGATVCRVLPLPMISCHQGPLAIYPIVPEIMELTKSLGKVIIPRSENEYVTLAGGSAVMSTFFSFQASIVHWLEKKGVDTSSANDYIRSLLSGLAQTGNDSQEGLDQLIAGHETPGGLNNNIRLTLSELGWFDDIPVALNKVMDLSRNDLVEK